MQGVDLLGKLIQCVPERVKALSSSVSTQQSATGWSAKEEFGHLLDSAANNHQRIVRAQLEESPAMPDYDGDAWVALHAYQETSWPELIDRWKSLNTQLLTAARAVSDSAWSRTLIIGDSGKLTLRFVFDDYLDHMFHHLEHMGVEVADLR
jgi:hypothetical protein